jgi:putative peptidoglycan lipid II flippase
MQKPSDDTGTIAKSAGAVSGAVMCSRLLGLIREQVFAALFGAGFAYDSFVVAFRIPNLLRDLFGEGALSSAFVTVFSDYDSNKGSAATWKLASNVLVFIGILLSLLTLVGSYYSASILNILAPDFAQVANKMELTQKLTIIMFPFLIFISLSAVVMGILNTKGRFFVPAMASSFFNLGSIVGGVSLAVILPKFGQPAIAGMAVGTLIGGLLQFAMQLPTLKKVGFTFLPHVNLRDPGLKRILVLMVPAVIGLSATQINIFINTNFAASCAEGSVSWLNYAFRLVQFPIGVFGVALSIATLPVIARHAATKNIDKLKESYTSSLTMAFCLTVPATVGLIVLSESIIRLIFQHGAFTALDTIKTAEALSFYALGLVAYASVKIMVPVFYAIKHTRYPVIGSFLTVGANIIIIIFTIDHFQHKAIALSTSCTMLFNFLFLSIILYSKLSGYSLSYLFSGFGKVLFSALFMGSYLYWMQYKLAGWLAAGFFNELMGLFFLVVSSAILYGAVLYLMRLKELTLLTDNFIARIRR